MNGDHTKEATALFAGFAERHGLRYEIEHDAPVGVMWNFASQDGLTFPIVLALQNGDELNFGVSDFWSYFFPFKSAAAQFDRVLDAWMNGQARIAVTGPWGRVLQVNEDGCWRSIYKANRLFTVWKTPKRTIENRSSHIVTWTVRRAIILPFRLLIPPPPPDRDPPSTPSRWRS